MIPKPHHRSEGFSLIELMIAMAMVGILSAAMYMTFETQVRGQVSQDVSLQMTQSLRAAMEIMASDIRMAGCDPTEAANAQIVTAEDDNLILSMDIGGGPQGQPDGDINDANEIVRYTINGNGNLGRALGMAGPLEPLHSIDLACDVLDFVYLDIDGNPTLVPNKINAIQVSMVVRSADAVNPGFLRGYTDSTSYVNLQGQEILAPPNDTFRRFQLSATIDCRNL